MFNTKDPEFYTLSNGRSLFSRTPPPPPLPRRFCLLYLFCVLFVCLFHRYSLPKTMNETFNKTTEVTHTSKSRAIGIPEATFWCTIFILEAVLIVTGNLLITVVFVRSRRLQKRRYYLIINLAISDTLVGALALPMFIVPFGKSFNVWNTETAVHGDAMLFFDMFSGFASITFLTMISLERLYATLRPFSYRALKSRWYVLLTIIAWIVAASIPSLHLAAINYPDMQLSSTKKAMVSMWGPIPLRVADHHLCLLSDHLEES